MSKPTTEMLDTYFEELSHADKEAERTWFKAGIAAYCHLCSPASEGWKKEHGFMEDRTMKRDEQMMNAAEAYTEEVKATFTGSDEDKHQECLVAINDFCAGWREADSHPQWIPVEEKRPPFDWKDDGTWSTSLPILIYSIHGISIGTFQLDHVSGKSYWFFDGSKHEEFADGYRLITHWMPLPEAPRKEE